MVEECCLQAENLVTSANHPDARPGLTVRVCRVCGRRHFELVADPGVLGVCGAKTAG